MVEDPNTEHQYLQNLANEFGIKDINTIRMPEDIVKRFYKVNPDLKTINRRAMRTGSSLSQPHSPVPVPVAAAAPLPLALSGPHASINDPIVLSDSSDEEEDGYNTAPNSPTMGDSELDLTKKKLLFYKELCSDLQKQLNAISIHRTTRKNDKHHHRNTNLENTSLRSARKMEATARKVVHESRSRELPNIGRPPSSTYITQEEQVRNTLQTRIPNMRQRRLQREFDENRGDRDDSDDSDYMGSHRSDPSRRNRLKYRRKSAAPPPPYTHTTRTRASGAPTPAPAPVVPIIPQQPTNAPHVSRRIQPTLVHSYSFNVATYNNNQNKHSLNYKPLHQSLGLHIENNNAGPSQANNISQRPLCPTEAAGSNCVDPTCNRSHFCDFLQ